MTTLLPIRIERGGAGAEGRDGGHRIYAREAYRIKQGAEMRREEREKGSNMMLKKDKQAAAKSMDVFKAIGDANVVIKVNGEVCGAEMFPAFIAAGVVVGSRLHTDMELRSESADELIKLVTETAVGIEKEFYGDFHRRTFDVSRARAEEHWSATRADTDEDLEELGRAMAQASLDCEPDKAEA